MSRIDAASPYRITGQVTSMVEHAKNKPDMVYAATAEQIAELKLHDEQVAARLAAIQAYADAHPDQIYAQVMVDGKAVATVYDSGITMVMRNVAGLALTEHGEGLALAKARLADIAQAIPGQIIYSDFDVPPGRAPAGNIPDIGFPKVTARGLVEMTRDMDWKLARARMEQDANPVE